MVNEKLRFAGHVFLIQPQFIDWDKTKAIVLAEIGEFLVKVFPHILPADDPNGIILNPVVLPDVGFCEHLRGQNARLFCFHARTGQDGSSQTEPLEGYTGDSISV
jgi:hypothetical protein